jgi:hypothetical protein
MGRLLWDTAPVKGGPIMHPQRALQVCFFSAALAAAACTPPTSLGTGPLPGTPSSSPGTTPTPGSPSSLGLTPSSLSFTNTGSGAALTFAAAESGYSGTLTQTSTCSGMAVVTPSSASGPNATFTVTPSAGGSCVVTITDASSQKATVTISITTSGLVLQ